MSKIVKNAKKVKNVKKKKNVNQAIATMPIQTRLANERSLKHTQIN